MQDEPSQFRASRHTAFSILLYTVENLLTICSYFKFLVIFFLLVGTWVLRCLVNSFYYPPNVTIGFEQSHSFKFWPRPYFKTSLLAGSLALIYMRVVNFCNSVINTFKECLACMSTPSAVPITIQCNRYIATTLVIAGKHWSRCNLLYHFTIFSFIGTLSAYGGAHVYADPVVSKYM